jgi:hypothetical protein
MMTDREVFVLAAKDQIVARFQSIVTSFPDDTWENMVCAYIEDMDSSPPPWWNIEDLREKYQAY